MRLICKLIELLFALLVFCIILPGCRQNPKDMRTSPVSSAPPGLSDTGGAVQSDIGETEDVAINSVWKEKAKKVLVKIDAYEYFFDTDDPVAVGDEDDFPLYKRNIEDGCETYMGLTGYALSASGKYLYVESNIEYGDYGRWQTRVISLNDGVVYPMPEDIHLYIPPDGKKIYYTKTYEPAIYCSVPTMQGKPEKLDITLPDISSILKNSGYTGHTDTVKLNAIIKKVEQGWIYFHCDVDDVPYDTLYSGNYRIRKDGKHTEKTDQGEYFKASGE